MDPSLKKDAEDIAKISKVSFNEFINNLLIKVVTEFKGNPQAAQTFNLKKAQEELVAIVKGIQQKQRLLGYLKEPSKKYRELEELCKFLGLKEDLSNLEAVMLKFTEYVPSSGDSFTKGDMGVFQIILSEMKEGKMKQAEIEVATKKANA